MYSDENQSNPILVEVYRAGILESFHRGAVCVVDEFGDIVFSLGNPMQICYPRSAMKFVQALPLIELGGVEKFGFTPSEVAVMCGSHNAEEAHLIEVKSILNKIGLNESYLNCGAQYPSSKKDSNELIKKEIKPADIHNNCSGKHAGMLALCLLMGYDTNDYLNPNHPAQQLILNYVEDFYEYSKAEMTTALDGCSAPIYSIPVYNQALCFRNLIHPTKFDEKRQKACKYLIDAISANPFMVAGTARYCTDMMEVCAPEIIGKTGAEGIFCLGIQSFKLGICIKIDDGKMQPQYNVAQHLIKMSNLFSQEALNKLSDYEQSPISNFNKLVSGEIKVNDAVFKPWDSYLKKLGSV